MDCCQFCTEGWSSCIINCSRFLAIDSTVLVLWESKICHFQLTGGVAISERPVQSFCRYPDIWLNYRPVPYRSRQSNAVEREWVLHHCCLPGMAGQARCRTFCCLHVPAVYSFGASCSTPSYSGVVEDTMPRQRLYPPSRQAYSSVQRTSMKSPAAAVVWPGVTVKSNQSDGERQREAPIGRNFTVLPPAQPVSSACALV